jgi:hypothetical protein
MLLNKAEWMAKHDSSAKFKALPKAEKERRYKQYIEQGPDPMYARKNATTRESSNQVTRYKKQAKTSKSVTDALHMALGAAISPGGHDYLTARFNPFCPRLQNVGYPDPCPGGSRKGRGFTEVTMQTNAAGFGFVCMSTDACAANQASYIMYSTGAWTATAGGFPPATGATGTVRTVLFGVPLGAADDVFETLMFRKIGFGIRIRNETALLNKAGLATSVDFPGGGDLLNANTDSWFRSNFPYWVTANVLNEGRSPWISAIWTPKSPADAVLTYLGGATTPNLGILANWDAQNSVKGPLANTAGPSYAPRWDLGICISGAPSATFQVQIVGFYEYVGTQYIPQMISSLTPTFSDPLANEAAEQTTRQVSTNILPKNSEGAVTMSGILDTVGGVVKTAISGYKALQQYLPATAPQASTPLQIEDVSNEASLGGFLEDSSTSYLPLIEDAAEELPLMLV